MIYFIVVKLSTDFSKSSREYLHIPLSNFLLPVASDFTGKAPFFWRQLLALMLHKAEFGQLALLKKAKDEVRRTPYEWCLARR